MRIGRKMHIYHNSNVLCKIRRYQSRIPVEFHHLVHLIEFSILCKTKRYLCQPPRNPTLHCARRCMQIHANANLNRNSRSEFSTEDAGQNFQRKVPPLYLGWSKKMWDCVIAFCVLFVCFRLLFFLWTLLSFQELDLGLGAGPWFLNHVKQQQYRKTRKPSPPRRFLSHSLLLLDLPKSKVSGFKNWILTFLHLPISTSSARAFLT